MNTTLTVIELINLLEKMPDSAQVVLELEEHEAYDLGSATFDPETDVVVLRQRRP